MSITKILLNLNIKNLLRDKGRSIHCPFSIIYHGNIHLEYPRDVLESDCNVRCGVLYKKLYTSCPCNTYKDKYYVRRKFWSAMRKAYAFNRDKGDKSLEKFPIYNW